MEKIHQLLSHQRENGQVWAINMVEKYSEATSLKKVSGSMPNYWVYGMLVPDKTKYINSFREQGYFASGVHLNNNEYSVFNNKAALPGVKDFYNKFIALPSGWWVTLN